MIGKENCIEIYTFKTQVYEIFLYYLEVSQYYPFGFLC